MNPADFATLLRAQLPDYVANASITRNRHMNQWRGDDPDAALTTALVGHLLDAAGDVPMFLPSFVDTMMQAAQLTLADFDDVPADLRAAVLVDYINWAAGCFFGCDIALYTIDLEKP